MFSRKNFLLGLTFIIFLSILLYFIKNQQIVSQKPLNSPNYVNETMVAKKASEKGIDWLIKHRDELAPDDVTAYLIYYYRITKDEKKAKEVLSVINDRISFMSTTSGYLTVLKNKAEYGNTSVINILYYIYAKRCVGKDYAEDLNNIKVILSTNPELLMTKTLNMTVRMKIAYLLKNLGFNVDEFYVDTIREIRKNSSILDNSSNSNYYSYLLSLTHIIYAESGYFKRYLNAKNYPIELNGFNKSLDVFLSKPKFSSWEIEVLSEVLLGLKILGVDSNEKTNMLHQKIIAQQNIDGSWGTDIELENGIPHHTAIAAIALSPFTEKLRDTTNICLSKIDNF